MDILNIKFARELVVSHCSLLSLVVSEQSNEQQTRVYVTYEGVAPGVVKPNDSTLFHLRGIVFQEVKVDKQEIDPKSLLQAIKVVEDSILDAHEMIPYFSRVQSTYTEKLATQNLGSEEFTLYSRFLKLTQDALDVFIRLENSLKLVD